MIEKILYYLILPFATIFFCIFGFVANVSALEINEIETRQINHARFWHSYENPNTGVYSIDQNSANQYAKRTLRNHIVYGLSTTTSGLNNTNYQFYTIPINSTNTELYRDDLSVHFKFSYVYLSSYEGIAKNLIPYMSFNIIDLMNDSTTLTGVKDLLGFYGDLFDIVEIDQDMFKTNYLFFYYPKTSTCNLIENENDSFNGYIRCDVEFNFPQGYFQDIPINDIYFGFWNKDKKNLDSSLGYGIVNVLDNYDFWYGEPYETPSTIDKNVSDIKDSLTSEELPDVNNAFSGINLDTNHAISDLLLLPINFLKRVLNLSVGICEDWDLDFGLTGIPYKLHLPCLNVSHFFGLQLWNTIDFLCCFFMIYNIIMLMISAFEDITSLRDTYNGLYQPKHAEGSYQGKHVRE